MKSLKRNTRGRMAKRAIKWIRPWPLPFTRSSSSASPVHRARLGSARLGFARLFSFTLAGGDDSLSDDCARRKSAFHSFGRLSLKIFAFDHTVAALSRSSARARARALPHGGEGRVEGRIWDRARGLVEYRGGRGDERVAEREEEGKGPQASVTFRGYPDACRRIGFDPRGCG